MRGNIGNYLNESLPIIKGFVDLSMPDRIVSGAFKKGDYMDNSAMAEVSGVSYFTEFDASLSSPTYQDNAPVQQNAGCVNYIIKY